MNSGGAQTVQPEQAGAAQLEELQVPPAWQRSWMGLSGWVGLVLVALIVVFSAVSGTSFLSVDNLRNLATDAAITLVLGVGATYVIITAGIDLSIGSVLVFASVLSVKAMGAVGGDGLGTSLVGLAVALAGGLSWGLLNGLLVAKARVPALIATLGSLAMALGAALVITGGVDDAAVPQSLVNDIGTGRLLGQLPYLALIAFAVALAGGIVLAGTRFGRYTYAVGSSREAARRSGVAVDRHLIKVYALAGTLSGLAGFLDLARFSTTSVAGHTTDNLQAIAGVVIGGTSLFGGIGSMVGTVFGVFIPAVLQNGFVIAGVQPYWQLIAVGAVLVAAVWVQNVRRQAVAE